MPPKGKSDPPDSTVDTPVEPTSEVEHWLTEVERLERENAELKRKLGEAMGASMVRLETDATPMAGPRRLVISQGVWDDLLRHGEVQDPGSGYMLRRNAESARVEVIDRRTGEPAEGMTIVEMRG